jgi:N-glycosidase YbiA
VPGVIMTEDRLHFFSCSADLPPGHGVHEQIANPGPLYRAGGGCGTAADAIELLASRHHARAAYVPHGRARLPGGEDRLGRPGTGRTFALESGTDPARGDGGTARRHRKLVLLDDIQLREWNGRKHTVMRDATR